MNKIPKEYKYTKNHEWVRIEEDGSVVVGITDYAQESLGDITYVELPEGEQVIERGTVFGVVESVKAASDLYMPVSGRILGVNPDISNEPELINDSPYEAGWMLHVQPEDDEELSKLMDADEYLKITKSN